LNAVLPTIRSLNASLVVVSPQLPAFLKELKEPGKIDFDILHDAANQTAEAFGIMMRLPDELIAVYRRRGVDLERFNGDHLWRLPVPARIVIDKAGKVRSIEADPDYTTRPEPDATVAALRAL
jgi:peroxiredoxin